MIIATLAFIVIFSGAILIHEMGHFVVAKNYGVPVYEFCIGFPGTPKAAILFRHEETEFTLRLLPFGGYVLLNNGENENQVLLSELPFLRKVSILSAGCCCNIAFGAVLMVIAVMAQESIGFLPALQVVGNMLWVILAGTMGILGDLNIHQLAGPFALAGITSKAMASGLVAIIGLTGLINVSIGLTNLLPIPGFDGWHIAMSIVEELRGKPCNLAVHNAAALIGFGVFAVLMAIVTYNDIFAALGLGR